MDRQPARHASPGYQLFMLALCLFALGALAARAMTQIDPRTLAILDYADYAVCAVFLADFGISLIRAENKWQYLARWGWLDLLSAIPTLDVARWGRVARVLRAFRLLRGLRATRVLAGTLLRHRAENTVLAVSLLALLLIVFCSIGILQFEATADANIRTAEDAIWWAFATITTVGYGDRFPVTTEGRVVAAILMGAGVGLFGTLSGLLAAWFIGPQAHQDDDGMRVELAALKNEVRALRRKYGAARE